MNMNLHNINLKQYMNRIIFNFLIFSILSIGISYCSEGDINYSPLLTKLELKNKIIISNACWEILRDDNLEKVFSIINKGKVELPLKVLDDLNFLHRILFKKTSLFIIDYHILVTQEDAEIIVLDALKRYRSDIYFKLYSLNELEICNPTLINYYSPTVISSPYSQESRGQNNQFPNQSTDNESNQNNNSCCIIS